MEKALFLAESSQVRVRFAKVVLDVQVKDLKDRLFTYRVPDEMQNDLCVGAQVIVPFGPRQLPGYIVSVADSDNSKFDLKEIREVVEPEPLFDKSYIDFLSYIAGQYCASLQEVIAAAIPACLTTKIKRLVRLTETGADRLKAAGLTIDLTVVILELLQESARGVLSLTTLHQRSERLCRLRKIKVGPGHFQKALKFLVSDGLIDCFNEDEGPTGAKTANFVGLLDKGLAATAKQKGVVEMIESGSDRFTISSLAAAAGVSRSVVERMIQQGSLSLVEEQVSRDALANLPQGFIERAQSEHKLTAEQQDVFEVLRLDLQERLQLSADESLKLPVKPWLLHGVTGSGKTEVYLRLIAETLNEGRTALFLVPEISLTPQLSGRLRARFGSFVAVWHSAISAGERYDTWRRLRNGEVRVLVGARSAILAHIPDIGLIILDEEHDGSYKQSSPSPRYNARDLALELARRTGAQVLLGSATPDIVSYERARAAGTLLRMPNRVFQQAMPKVTVVDMRKEFSEGRRSVFSSRLNKAIAERLERNEQTVLLINRRGFANHIFCQACGHVVRCKNCSVTLTLHKKLQSQSQGQSQNQDDFQDSGPLRGFLACHHCGFRMALQDDCPACKSPFLKVSGLGTQKVEQEVLSAHPAARVVRLDSDVAAQKGAYERVLNDFTEGRADILIGTQMVAKGLDIPRVTLVGVLSADAAFNLPDYRSSERGFQLLTQVAGRAGRGDKPGEVVLQTYAPELQALRLASRHDYENFFEPELLNRKDFEYPPFSQLIRIVVSGEDSLLVEAVAELIAEEIGRLLEDIVAESDVRILGPAPCLIEKIKKRYRYHLIIKNKAGKEIQDTLTNFLKARRFGPQVNIAVDVDALDMI